MTKTRVGINGLGRIGRTILREWLNRKIDDFEIVAVNNLGDPNEILHLLKYDSVHGKALAPIQKGEGCFTFGENKISFYTEKDPTKIPWSEHNIEIVIDSTGVFKDRKGLGLHKSGTVKKVIMCAPGDDLNDSTFVMGINHHYYDNKKHDILSNASCTTNCLAPIAKVLNDNFKINSGLMVTVHSYTSDQCLIDGIHKDPRRARSAALSMIPTSTGAAKALGLVIPELGGKLDGYAIRVPTPDVSLVDLTVQLEKKVTKDEVNMALKAASEGALKGVLEYCSEKLVSVDFMGNRHSSIVDSSLTNVIDRTVKVVAWYDNEIGFSNRVLDLVSYVGGRL